MSLCRELNTREVDYVVVGGFAIRVAGLSRTTGDVDLVASASGIDYAEASKSVVVHEVDGVAIPFASPELLWRMKRRTHREKDRGDLEFLRQWFAARGQTPPED